MKRPNVLFIISDQHSAKHLGCEDKSRYGNAEYTVAKTPNLDRMAAEGVRFANAITQNPICTPSRVCWVSGQYAHNTGIYGLSGPNPGGLPTVFGHFRKFGYLTGLAGKIHGPEYWEEDDCDIVNGSDGASFSGVTAYRQYLDSRHISGSDVALDPKTGERKIFEGQPSHFSYRDSQEGWCVTKAKEMMLRAKEENRPFFYQIAFGKPHQIYAPAQEFWDMYKHEDLKLPPSAKGYDMQAAKKAPHMVANSNAFKTGFWTAWDPAEHEAGKLRKLHGYLGNVSQVDYAVGELLDFLKENGLEEDTIVVYSTDHGEYATEHDLIEKAPGICSDSVTRIPMIWKWKNHFPEGIVKEQIVETLDFTQTVCDLCGLPDMPTSDGEVITPLLMGQDKEIHECGLTEFAWSKSLRVGDYRLVWYPREMFRETYPDGFGELYNLKDDPWEMHNLWFEPEYREQVIRMTGMLLDRIVVTTRPVSVHDMDVELGPDTYFRNKRVLQADGKINVKDAIPNCLTVNYL